MISTGTYIGYVALGVALTIIAISQAVGQAWEKITPVTSVAPTPRYNSSMVYDNTGNNLIVFGGRGASGNLNEVWSFNIGMKTWSDITPADTNQPAKRFSHNAIYDPQSHSMFIWSGQGIGFYNDVWAFDLVLQSWQKMSPGGTIPNPRYGSASVYDPVNRRLVTFAGFTDAGRFDDTQAYGITTNVWTNLTPSGTNPQIRCLHTASYDPTRHRMIMYAGQRSGPLDDIWAFDFASTTWSNLTPTFKPAGRFFSSSIYVNDRFIVFGGETTAGNVDELLSFNLIDSTWTIMNPSGQIPGRRNSHSAVYVANENAMFMFGGNGDSLYNDVWKLSDIPTDVKEHTRVPEAFQLLQNYPNPFNPETTIGFMIKDPGFTSLNVYDLLGREIAIIVSEQLPAGTHTRTWNAENVPNGVYFYRLRSGQFVETRSMVLLK